MADFDIDVLDTRVPVTVLTGFLGSGKVSVEFQHHPLAHTLMYLS